MPSVSASHRSPSMGNGPAPEVSTSSPAMRTRTTVMRPVVSVPVLSEQMVVADPIVSHALRWRTRLLSRIIFLTEKARVMATARGRPSGTATTKTVTPMTSMRRYSRWWIEWSHTSLQQSLLTKPMTKRMNRMATVSEAAMPPPLVMRSVMWLSLASSTLSVSSASFIFSSMSPWYVLVPTARTTMRPSPSCTKVPAKTMGEMDTGLSTGSLGSTLKGPLRFSTDSPVSIASEIPRSFFSITIPSAQTMSPVLSKTTSPTTMLWVEIFFFSPSRMQKISTSSFLARRALNCWSF
mmetsp:Transcript_60784/g.162517  ORF Transcript_60784/g.162517 Transcript_60784/m.162517 type:complete len:294 (+) Transcript_60784:619-1500(+)